MKLNRRKFIKRLILGVASIEAFFLIKGGINQKSELVNNKQLLNIGKIETFKKGQIYPFLQQKFYLKRFEDGGFMAISLKCTHLGCIVNYNSNSKGFACPCHASQFDKFGQVLSSPATRPLDLYPIITKNGELYVDLNRAQKRKAFRKSQITYA